jgi:hypothetical protein
MTLLLYAIAGCAPEEIDGNGLEDRPLRAIGEDDLVAVVTHHDRAPGKTGHGALWEYEQIVESLMARHSILPARFGSRFDDETDVRTMVRDRRDQLAAAVALVRDAVEVSVSAIWPERAEGNAGDTGANPGTAYMLARVQHHKQAQEIARRLEPLSRAARASTHTLLSQPTLPFQGAYLVARDELEHFTDLVREIDAGLEEAELACTGPWPPYSFAEGGRS